MGQSGSEKTKATQTVTPDPLTDKWRNQVFNSATPQLNQTPSFYPGQTVAPLSQQTQSGLGMLTEQAQGGAPGLNQAYQSNSRIMNGWNPAMPYAQRAAAGGLSANPVAGDLQSYGGASNPYLDNMFAHSSRQVSDAVNANFAQSGRYGANAGHTGALTRELGGLASSIYAPAYESERSRGLAADQTRAALYESGADRSLQATDMLGSLYGVANGQALQAQQQLPSLYAYGQMPAAAMLQAGSIYDQQNQSQIDADRERYDYGQNAGWNRLQEYAAMMSGMPVFTTTNQTGSTKNKSFGIGWSAQNGLTLGG